VRKKGRIEELRIETPEISSLLLVALFVAVLITGAVPLGIPGQWVWPRRAVPLWGTSAILALLALTAGAGSFLLLLKRPPKARWAWMAVPFGLALVVRLLFFHAEPTPIVKQIWVTASPVSNAYFSEALRARPATELVRNYTLLLPKLAEHARTHPPGPILYYKAFLWVCKNFRPLVAVADRWATGVGGLSLSETAALVGGRTGLPLDETSVAAALWAQAGLCVLSAGSVLACFLLALSLGLDRKTALGAAALLSLSPSANLFSITIDTAVSLACALSLLFTVKGEQEGWPFLGLSGFMLYLASFLSLSALATGAMCGLYILLSRGGSLKGRLAGIGWMALGFLLTHALVGVTLGFDLFWVIAHGLVAHREVTVAFERSYFGWLILNPLDFATLSGLPICVLAWAGRGEERSRCLLLAFLLTLGALDISGMVRGEVARIWLFLLVPLCVLGGVGLERVRLPVLHLLLLALQAVSAKVWLDAVRPF